MALRSILAVLTISLRVFAPPINPNGYSFVVSGQQQIDFFRRLNQLYEFAGNPKACGGVLSCLRCATGRDVVILCSIGGWWWALALSDRMSDW
jgi:hypothetical protein